MIGKIAILWRGDHDARRTATPRNNRYHRIFEELEAWGIAAEPAVYSDDLVDEVRELLGVEGVLVWVDPIHEGLTRATLDPMLRDVATRGPWVSAHPDTILTMGTKEVLHRTKDLGWGTDTQLYRTDAEFRAAFPARLRAAGPRVLKQNRGNGGQGFGRRKSCLVPIPCACCTLAVVAWGEDVPLTEFMPRCAAYFSAPDGCIIDQPFTRRHDPLLHGR